MLTNPWILLGLVLAWIGSVAGVGWWQNDAGSTAERVIWQEREMKALAKSNKAIQEANDAARETEREHATAMDGIAKDYERRLKDAKDQKDRDVAAAYSGAIGLRIPRALPGAAGTGEAAHAASSPGQCDVGAQAELPREAAANLLAIANDADAVTDQLAACQAIILQDRQQ